MKPNQNLDSQSTIEREILDGGTCYITLLHEGEVVSWLFIIDLEMRIGSAVVRTGIITRVGTEKAHRNRGFSRCVMNDALNYMREADFEMSSLFGIQNFYEKWGYARTIPTYIFDIATEAIASAVLRHRVVNYAEEHRLALLRMYNENNHDRTRL